MCPFRYRRRWTKFTFGVAPDFMDQMLALDDEAEREYNKKYPTCWLRFRHWLGWDAAPRYIRAGDMLTIYGSDGSKVPATKVLRIEGFGKYAAVMLDPVGAIRRDLITKDENGNWFYRYDD